MCSPSDHTLPIPRYLAPRPELRLRGHMADEAAEAFCRATAEHWAPMAGSLPETVAAFLAPGRMAGATSYRAHVVSEWGVIAAAWAAAADAVVAGEAACAAIAAKSAEHGWPPGAHDGRPGGYDWDLGTGHPQHLPGYEEASASVIRRAMADEVRRQQQVLLAGPHGRRADVL